MIIMIVVVLMKRKKSNRPQEKTSDAQCGCSPPADQGPAHPRAVM